MISGIQALPLENFSQFTQDARNVAAAESYLRRALEALLDLGRHILAKGFNLAVSEYKEIPARLQRVGILSEKEARLMAEMAGYRNRLVHFYVYVFTEELFEICASQVTDVATLARQLGQWVASHPEKVDHAL
jgi:uncharacterized protein YutE (UPF0331/DUF86 family)